MGSGIKYILVGIAMVGLAYLSNNSSQETQIHEQSYTSLSSQAEIAAPTETKQQSSSTEVEKAEKSATVAKKDILPSPIFTSNKDEESHPVSLEAFMDQDISKLADLPKVSLNVNGKKYSVTRSSMNQRGANNFTWVGKVDGDANSLVVMTQVNGIYEGSVKTKHDFYNITYNEKTDGYIMKKINRLNYGDDALHADHEAHHDHDEEPRMGAANIFQYTGPSYTGANNGGSSSGNTAAASSGGNYISDMIVFYSRDTYSSSSGESSVIAKVHNGVEMINQAFINSDVHSRIRLLNIQRSSSSTSGHCPTDLRRMYQNDGHFDEIPSVRTQYGADLVTLVTTCRKDNIIGTAYFPGGSNTNGLHSINRDYVSTPMWAHEVGHNYGLAHQNGGSGTYSYGRPHQFGSNKWTTIMWSHYQSSRHLYNYSNPNVFHDGMATGTSSKDNARAARNMSKRVSEYRATKVVSLEPIISSISSDKAVVIGDALELEVVASGSDLSYQWKKDGSNLSDGNGITGSKTASLRIQSTKESDSGKYQVQVSNSHGSVLSGQISVSVGQVQAPTANAGSNQSVYTNTTVTLDGSKSTDPQGYNLSYSWAQLSGPTANLSGANTAKPTFVAGTEGTYEFRLTVSNGQLSSTDTVRVTAEEVDLGSLQFKVALLSISKSSTKYHLQIDGTSVDINQVKQVYYHYYKTNGTYVNSQRSTSKSKKFGFNKLIKETFLVKAEVQRTDGTKIYLDGVLEKKH